MRTMFFAVSALVALLASQIPEFLQQYQQRLGGSADELTTIVRHFDEDSRRSGYEEKEALQLMKRNPEKLIRDQSLRMNDNIARLARLRQQQEALTGGAALASFFAFIANYDEPIAQKTYNSFVPALPLTFTGFIFAIVGFSLSYSTLLLLFGVLKISSRPTEEA